MNPTKLQALLTLDAGGLGLIDAIAKSERRTRTGLLNKILNDWIAERSPSKGLTLDIEALT